MITEIRVATVAVRDLTASRSFYERAFSYVEIGSGTVGGPAFEALWQMPAGLSGEVLVLGPEGATSGLLRLVQFDQPGELYWGDYGSKQDLGEVESGAAACEKIVRAIGDPHRLACNSKALAWLAGRRERPTGDAPPPDECPGIVRG